MIYENVESHLISLNTATTRREAADTVRMAGSRPTHVLSRHTIIGTAGDLKVIKMPAEAAETGADLTERLSLEAYGLRATPEYQSRPRTQSPWLLRKELGVDAGVDRFMSRAAGFSDYLIGSVAYAIVFVDGPEDLGFNEGEMKYAIADVQTALGWFAQSEPRASLSFFPEIQRVSIDAAPCTNCTNLEALEAVWRDPAIEKLGFGKGITGVEAYASSLRQLLQTQWAFVLFFTKYPIGDPVETAYAAAPRIVVRIHDDVLANELFAFLIAHEIGHLFGCPDEYFASNCKVTDRTGFLNVENGNCVTTSGAAPIERCVMFDSSDKMCRFTRLQLGWRDSNNNDILDPLETPRVVVFSVSIATGGV